jgi:hypothetical protein
VGYTAGAGDVGQRFAAVTAGNGFALLMRCQLDARGLRPGAAFAGVKGP